jgi:hypothetical protein
MYLGEKMRLSKRLQTDQLATLFDGKPTGFDRECDGLRGKLTHCGAIRRALLK